MAFTGGEWHLIHLGEKKAPSAAPIGPRRVNQPELSGEKDEVQTIPGGVRE